VGDTVSVRMVPSVLSVQRAKEDDNGYSCLIVEAIGTLEWQRALLRQANYVQNNTVCVRIMFGLPQQSLQPDTIPVKERHFMAV
jgi:hypothetical protein